MKFLANENIPLASIRQLRAVGLEVISASEESPGDTDLNILKRAASEGLVIITFDRDYGELIYKNIQLRPAAVIYFRFKPKSPVLPAQILLKLLEAKFPIIGKFSVVEFDKVRQRDLPAL